MKNISDEKLLNIAAKHLGQKSAFVRRKKMGDHAFKMHMRKIAKLPRKSRNG